jgi:predicted dehydrogenase
MKSPLDHCIAQPDNQSVRIGILGCSDIARRKFIPALANCKNALLFAVSSRDLKSTARLFPDCMVTGYEELLESPTVDLVYLSLPNHLHEEWTIKALEAGKHVICEKPLTTTLASTEKILDCASKNRRLIYENQMFLFHPQHAIIKNMIDAGKIGRIKALRSFFGFPYPKEGDFRLDPLQGGGAFHDLARYPLGIASYLLSSLPHVFRGHSTWRGSLNTSVTGTSITRNDEIFTFSIRFGQQYEAVYEVIGETGMIRLERAYTTPSDYENRIFFTTGNRTEEISVPAADHFKLMIESICNIIQTNSDFSFLNRQAATIALLADQMEKGCMEKLYEQ